MKIAVSLVLALLFCLPVCAMAETPASPASDIPTLSVSAGEVALPCIAAPTRWNGAQFKRPDVMASLMEQITDQQYVALGTKIELTLDGLAPDSAVLSHCIINPDGSAKYSADPTTQTLSFADGNASFVLAPDMMAMLSSILDDYLPGNTWRGFKLRCTWGENECEYAFMLRTDADITAAEATVGIDPEQVARIDIVLRDGRTASVKMPAEMWSEYSVSQLFELAKPGDNGESVSVIVD